MSVLNITFGESQKAMLKQRFRDAAATSVLLDIGDLQCGLVDEPRRKVVAEQWRSVFSDECDAELVAFFESNAADAMRIEAAARSGEPLYFWTDHSPQAECGFLYWTERFCERDVPIYRDERLLTADDRETAALRWRQLVRENAPLRAVISGTAVSVAEDFYDIFLRRCMPDGEFIMAKLLGLTLGRYPLGVGDGWYAGRIRAMIRAGELIQLNDGDGEHPYSMLLRRSK